MPNVSKMYFQKVTVVDNDSDPCSSFKVLKLIQNLRSNIKEMKEKHEIEISDLKTKIKELSDELNNEKIKNAKQAKIIGEMKEKLEKLTTSVYTTYLSTPNNPFQGDRAISNLSNESQIIIPYRLSDNNNLKFGPYRELYKVGPQSFQNNQLYYIIL